MKSRIHILMVLAAVIGFTFTTGCATTLRKPESAPQPPTVKFSHFKAVQLKEVTISPAFASSGANQKAARKINQLLVSNMRPIFANVQVVPAGTVPEKAAARTLLITPIIEEIKFIGGGARFMVGAMAGSSAVLMKVSYTDAATGDIVATPEFYRAASAWQGGQSMGSTDNEMLKLIVQDICDYSRVNSL